MPISTFGLGHSATGQQESLSVFGLGALPSFIEGNDILIELQNAVYRVVPDDVVTFFEIDPTCYVLKVSGTVNVFEIASVTSLFSIEDAISVIEVDRQVVKVLKVADAISSLESESTTVLTQDDSVSKIESESTSEEFNPKVKK